MKLDLLLEELRRGGRLESSGVFSINPRVARRKMRIYQLADPHHYALLLVAFGLGRGASRVGVESGASDCTVQLEGVGLTLEEAQALVPSLFSSRSSRDQKLLRLLAYALNGAVGLRPRWVRVRSREGVHLDVDESGERLRSGSVEAGGLAVRVKGRLCWKALGRRELGPEGAAVLERCGWAPQEITVNGRPVERKRLLPCVASLSLISDDPEAALVGPGRRSAVAVRSTGEQPCSVLIGIPTTPLKQARLHLVRWGVEVSVRTCRELILPVQAVVSCPDLRLNVSQSDVVEDAVYREVVELVNGQIVRLLEAMAERYRELDEQARPVARHCLCRYLAERPGSLHEAPCCCRPTAPPPAWRNWCRSCLHVTDRTWEALPLGGVPAVLTDEVSEPVLRAWFPNRVSARALLEQAREALGRRRRWERGPAAEPRVDRSCRVRLPLEGLEGELGLEEPAAGCWEIAYFKQRRLLAVRRYGAEHAEHGGRFPAGLRVAVNHDGLLPTQAWDDVQSNSALAEIFSSIHQCLPYLFERVDQGSRLWREYRAYRKRLGALPEAPAEPMVLNRLRSRCLVTVELPHGRLGLTDTDRAGEVLLYRGPDRPPHRLPLCLALPPGVTGLVLKEAPLESALKQALPHLYAAYLAQAGPSGLDRLLEYLATVRPQEVELPGALESMPLFPSATGDLLSLAEIRTLVAERGWVGYLRRVPRKVAPEPVFLVLEPDQARQLEHWLGPSSLRADPDGYRRELQRAQFMGERELQPPLVHGLHRRPLQYLKGEIALADADGPDLRLQILYSGRRLVEQRLSTGLTPLEITVEGGWLTPRSDWSDVVEDEAYEILLEEVHHEVESYSTSLLELSGPRVLEHLWRHLATANPPEELRRAPLFALAPSGSAKYQELSELQKKQGWLGYVDRQVRFVPEPQEMVLAAGAEQVVLLSRVFRHGPLINVSAFLRSREHRRAPAKSALPETLGECGPGVAILASPRAQSVLHLSRFRVDFTPERLNLPVPVFARVREDGLNPEPNWRRVRRDPAFFAVVDRINIQAAEWVLTQARDPNRPRIRHYLLGLARKFAEGGAEPSRLTQTLRELPFWRDAAGGPVSLSQLESGVSLFLCEEEGGDREVLGLIARERRVTMVPAQEVSQFRALAYRAQDFSRGLCEAACFYREGPGASLLPSGEAWLEEEGLRILKEPGPATVTVAWHGRRLGRLELRLPFAFQALVEEPGLLPASRRGGFSDRQEADRVAARAVGKAVAACCRLTRGPQDPALRSFLGELFGRLERRCPESLVPLLEALRESPLFESVGGERLTPLRLLATAPEPVCTVSGKAELEKFPVELRRRAAYRLGGRAGLVLHLVFPLPQDVVLRLGPQVDATEEFLDDCRALENQNRPPFESLALEDHFPGERWLRVVSLQEGDFAMEGGLCARPGAPRELILTIDRVLLARFPSPLPGLSAVMDGPFLANRSWSGLEDPAQAERLAWKLADALLAGLAEGLPPAV